MPCLKTNEMSMQSRIILLTLEEQAEKPTATKSTLNASNIQKGSIIDFQKVFDHTTHLLVKLKHILKGQCYVDKEKNEEIKG